MDTRLTLKRVPATTDNRVRVDSLPSNTPFIYGTAFSDVYLLVGVDNNRYINRKEMFVEGKLACVALSTGLLCHISRDTPVLPIAGAVLNVPITN